MVDIDVGKYLYIYTVSYMEMAEGMAPFLGCVSVHAGGFL